MLQLSYYHELLDGIFYELERYSCFRIFYRTVARTNESGDSFVLDSVNRMNDPELFGKALEKLITEVRARMMAGMKVVTIMRNEERNEDREEGRSLPRLEKTGAGTGPNTGAYG
ncbi:MAG: hypothetical protein WCP32_18105 [Bacteroidota bacterium]